MPIDPDKVAVVVNGDGRIQGTFQGPFADEEAVEHMRTCKRIAGMNEKRGGVLKDMHVVTGEEAKKAMQKGRI